MPPIRVLVVEDSAVVRDYLVHVLAADGGMTIVGAARDGVEAVELAARLRPDLIVMDAIMPRLDGLEATRRIMETNPVPIVIVSAAWNPGDVATTFRAIEAGALAILEKPAGPGHPESERMRQELVQTARLMSEVKVVRRWPRAALRVARKAMTPAAATPLPSAAVGIVAIGASTGGPQVLHRILADLPRDFAAPLVIVQHIAPGFVQGMVDWLSETSSVALHVGKEGDPLLPGHAYFAPDGFQMGVRPEGTIRLADARKGLAAGPSVASLFRAVAEVYGHRAAGVLLTGMGADGAAELRLMRDRGGITVIQNQESSVVFGMPGAAKALSAAVYELPPERIAPLLTEIVARREGRDGHGRQ
jgi:two-component system chemotaxis response regulator CheB